MKLALCPHCFDVFKLTRHEMRRCYCGKVSGRYTDEQNAEVSPEAISIAIGNGSLLQAILLMQQLHKHAPAADREAYIETAKIDFAWVRPNTGPGNPNTKLLE